MSTAPYDEVTGSSEAAAMTTTGEAFASLLEVMTDLDARPRLGDGFRDDFASLNDILIAGFETPYQHWRTRKYDPDAAGTDADPWAIVESLHVKEGDTRRKLKITADVVRAAVASVIDARLSRPEADWTPREALWVYCSASGHDANSSDSVIQHAIYGEDVFS